MKTSKKGLPWKQLWKIGKPFWVSEKRGSALFQLGVVLLLLFANAKLQLFINETAGHFSTAIEQKSITKFYYFLTISVVACVSVTPVQVFYDLMRTRLALIWRQWLSSNLFAMYYTNRAYYKLTKDGAVDNPDQRMTEDVDSFCNSSVGLFISILDAIVNVALFAGVLWSLTPVLTESVFGYSAGGSLIVILIGKALVALNFQRLKSEADLRFYLTESRREAESIAKFRGEAIALEQAKALLSKVIDTLMSIMFVNRNIQLFVGLFNRLMPLIPAAIMAPLYFKGMVPFGDITRATLAFTSVFQGATLIISQFSGISTYTAIINRIGGYIESVEEVNRDDEQSDQQIEITEGIGIAFDGVSILTSDSSKLVVNNLSMRVQPGQKILISGPDGSAKHAILRTLAGLCTSGSGKVTKPTESEMIFVGQNFYMPRSTLRQALTADTIKNGKDNTRLHQVLVKAKLPDLVKRAGGLDTQQNWSTFLNQSEQQRLGLARVLFNRPKYVIMDEATSALEPDKEKLFYSCLADLGATVISIGSNPTLGAYHDHLLTLSISGDWQFDPITKGQSLVAAV